MLFDSDLPAPLLACLLIWLFLLGATVGSFLNVVTYRLPRGQSLLFPGSRCPACGNPILARDNVPIAGWLWLGGRCRRCGVSISPRYPAVELLVACLFLLLALVGPVLGGVHLPPPNRGSVLAAGGWRPALLWGIYAYHLMLLCGLLCAALIRFDGHRVPPSLNIVMLAVGVAAPIAWPALRPVISNMPGVESMPAAAAGLAAGLHGLGIALLLGCVATWGLQAPGRSGSAASADGRDSSDEPGSPSGRPPGLAELMPLAWTGLYLGWQAAAALSATTAATHLATGAFGRIRPAARDIGCTGHLTLATTAWLFVWGPMTGWLPWLGPDAGLLTLLAATGMVAGASRLRGYLVRNNLTPS